MDSDGGQFKAGLDRMIGTLAGDSGIPDARELSPTLCSLEAVRRPDPMPVCGACPRSMWFLSKETGLKAYCRAMHAFVWASDNPQPIRACDGPSTWPSTSTSSSTW